MLQKTILAFLVLGLLVGCTTSEETEEPASAEIATEEEVVSTEEERVETLTEPSGETSRLYEYYENHYVDQDYYYDMRTTVSIDDIITETMSSTAEKAELSYMAQQDETANIAQIMDDEFIYLVDHDAQVVQKYRRPADYQSPMDQALDTISKLQMTAGEGEFFGESYETEFFEFMGTTTTYFFEGDRLVGYEQRSADQVSYSELLNFTSDVDQTIFDIPEDYEMEDFTVESTAP